jgi:hypothetical protein
MVPTRRLIQHNEDAQERYACRVENLGGPRT